MRPEFWRVLADVFVAYFESETNSSAGKLNLALCVLLGAVAIASCVPSVIVVLARIILAHDLPSWIYAVPLIAFIVLAVAAIASYAMLPKRPSDWIDPG